MDIQGNRDLLLRALTAIDGIPLDSEMKDRLQAAALTCFMVLTPREWSSIEARITDMEAKVESIAGKLTLDWVLHTASGSGRITIEDMFIKHGFEKPAAKTLARLIMQFIKKHPCGI